MKTRSGLAGGHLHDNGGHVVRPVTDTCVRASGAAQGPVIRKLGRFRLDEIIGRGSAATVFRAFDSEIGQSVALKVFSEAVGNPVADERHHREAAILERCGHPAVVPLLAMGADNIGTGSEHEYLSLELVDGADLRRIICTQQCSSDETVSWASKMLSALGHIHRLGIVHRDIKPANIMIGQRGSAGARPAKLIDFGNASFGNSVAPGTSLGTAQYMSPEQAREAGAGPASDIYSLGLVLIECLSGKPPFTGIAVATMVARTLRRPLLPDGISPALSSLLGAMTAMNPADRPSAAEAATELARS